MIGHYTTGLYTHRTVASHKNLLFAVDSVRPDLL